MGAGLSVDSRSFELDSRSFEFRSRSFELDSRSFELDSRSFESFFSFCTESTQNCGNDCVKSVFGAQNCGNPTQNCGNPCFCALLRANPNQTFFLRFVGDFGLREGNSGRLSAQRSTASRI